MEPGLHNCQADSSTTDLIKRRLSLLALKRSFQEMLPQQPLMLLRSGGSLPGRMLRLTGATSEQGKSHQRKQKTHNKF